ncbi:MAG: hypothetical protein RR654_09825 [Oscillospiraceae bacterium]
MKYHRGERFGLSEAQQSLIYWTCVSYKSLPFEIRHKIDDMCLKYGGQYYKELFEAVTTTSSIDIIAELGYVDKSTLTRKVKTFYCNWQSN